MISFDKSHALNLQNTHNVIILNNAINDEYTIPFFINKISFYMILSIVSSKL